MTDISFGWLAFLFVVVCVWWRWALAGAALWLVFRFVLEPWWAGRVDESNRDIEG